MNNNQMRFDPMTGQPINNINTNTNMNNNSVPNQNIQNPQTYQQVNQNTIQQPTVNQQTFQNAMINEQVQMQSIPTVDQTKQEFINNTQNMNTEKKENKKEGVNYLFIIILFAIMFAAIFFLFPILLKYI